MYLTDISTRPYFKDTQGNTYAYCAQCGFGIEVNHQCDNKIHANYHFTQDSKAWCYYCYESRKPRTGPQLKALLAESEVLLASAKRLSDAVAIAFYSNNVDKCRAALGVEPPAPAPQGSLF